MPERHVRGPSQDVYFLLFCGVCKDERWVRWSSLRAGATKCCSKCTRLPTLEKMHHIVKKYDLFWKPTLVFKRDIKTKRRLYWMTCKCGLKRWVRWNQFSMGLVRGCRSCSAIDAIKAPKDPMFRAKHPMKQAWYRIIKTCKETKRANPWKDFVSFKSWSIENGYKSGAMFRRKKRGLTDPHNFFWEGGNTEPGCRANPRSSSY